MNVKRRAAVALIAWALLLAACAGAQSPGTATPAHAPDATSGSVHSAGGTPTAEPSAAGSGTSGIVVGGDRPVRVQLPDGYDPSEPAPLLIMLHGYGADGPRTESRLNLAPVASAQGLLYAHPDGTRDVEGEQFWNASEACCNFHGSDVDDVAYLAGLVDEIAAALPVDRSRVYFAGHSNGGFMSYRMACERADMVAAVVSLAGATPLEDECRPSEPVAVAQVHGTDDDVVRYDGGAISGDRYPGARETVTTWAAYGGCDAAATDAPERLDLDRGLSRPDGSPAETRVESYGTGCAPGGHAELWTIEGGGHDPALGPGFADAVIGFLLAHAKPAD